MRINATLRELMLEGEGESGLEYQVTLNGETYQVGLEMNKEGINLELVPTNPDGDMIYNLTPEEIKTLRNTLMTSLSPKFAKYKLELASEENTSDAPSVKILIPIGSIFPFLQNIMSR